MRRIDVIAVDWSGAKTGAARHIWLAHARQGRLIRLGDGLDRSEVVDDLIARRLSCPEGLCVGLDFAFSLPEWFPRRHGCHCVEDVWALVEREGEGWLTDCAPPFWGRPGRQRPDLPEHFRRCDKQTSVGGISAKSVFQIGGAGAVGTGTLRGIPHLRRLHEGGFGIWPFHAATPWTVVEIYPRLLTGPVNKGDPEHRARYLERSPWTVSPEQSRMIIASEDAFDAAISALVMERHSTQLGHLELSSDPLTLLEGDIWRPSPEEPLHIAP